MQRIRSRTKQWSKEIGWKWRKEVKGIKERCEGGKVGTQRGNWKDVTNIVSVSPREVNQTLIHLYQSDKQRPSSSSPLPRLQVILATKWKQTCREQLSSLDRWEADTHTHKHTMNRPWPLEQAEGKSSRSRGVVSQTTCYLLILLSIILLLWTHGIYSLFCLFKA